MKSTQPGVTEESGHKLRNIGSAVEKERTFSPRPFWEEWPWEVCVPASHLQNHRIVNSQYF